MIVIINPAVPEWVKRGDARPSEWLKKYFPNEWEDQLITYGSTFEVGKYFAEEIMRSARESLGVGS
jgi:hypothetical protein